MACRGSPTSETPANADGRLDMACTRFGYVMVTRV